MKHCFSLRYLAECSPELLFIFRFIFYLFPEAFTLLQEINHYWEQEVVVVYLCGTVQHEGYLIRYLHISVNVCFGCFPNKVEAYFVYGISHYV